MKKNNKKGFTLAELLIVVAIIAVLVAIAIPIFTAQLEKSREATDASNIRSAYAEAMATIIAGDTFNAADYTVELNQIKDDWQKEDIGTSLADLEDDNDEILTVTVNIKDTIDATKDVTFTYTAPTNTTAGSLVIGQ
jgi:prepilin-type N-terminal cleavage/methylation domain-containing protein